jgi:hypothetical protein
MRFRFIGILFSSFASAKMSFYNTTAPNSRPHYRTFAFGRNSTWTVSALTMHVPLESGSTTMPTVADTMNSTHSRKRIVRLCLFLAVGLPAIGALALLAYAGLRGPGKYCGVVVFDRWDTCFLLSGPYITSISENVKNGLRPYAGKAIDRIRRCSAHESW